MAADRFKFTVMQLRRFFIYVCEKEEERKTLWSESPEVAIGLFLIRYKRKSLIQSTHLKQSAHEL